MKKLIGGLMATFALLILVMSTAANAEADPATETEQEVLPLDGDTSVPEPPTNVVDCTLLNFTPHELRNTDGNFVVGNPITLELAVLKGGPMAWYFVASQDGAEPHFLNDGMDGSLVWMPTEPGTYSIWGEFYGSKDGELIPVEDREACTVTLMVVELVASEPDPVVSTDSGTPSVINNVLVPEPPASQPAVTNPVVLARTGNGTSLLAVIGFGLLLCGKLAFIWRDKLATVR